MKSLLIVFSGQRGVRRVESGVLYGDARRLPCITLSSGRLSLNLLRVRLFRSEEFGFRIPVVQAVMELLGAGPSMIMEPVNWTRGAGVGLWDPYVDVERKLEVEIGEKPSLDRLRFSAIVVYNATPSG